MSQEIIQIIQSMDLRKLEMQLALQCSPLITGLKISNLLIVHNNDAEYVVEMFKGTDILCFFLHAAGEKTTFLLYRFEELSEYMNKGEVRKLLKKFGYKSSDLEQILITFRKRYHRFMIDEIEFPHEMGLFLGYPVEDVHGFIANEGKNFLYTGYWKVYDNLSEKINTFEKFNNSKEMVIKLVSYGVNILDIVKIYSKNELQSAAI